MRQKDEEANDFTRHELKNGVLAGLAQCDRLAMVHEQAVPTEWPTYDAEFCAVLGGMRKCLDQTLQGVLSHTLSIDINHGTYVPVTSPVDLLEVLSAGMAPLGELPITCTPKELPLVSLDSRLLLHIYRNAMSNAIKYAAYNLKRRTSPPAAHTRLRTSPPPQLSLRTHTCTHLHSSPHAPPPPPPPHRHPPLPPRTSTGTAAQTRPSRRNSSTPTIRSPCAWSTCLARSMPRCSHCPTRTSSSTSACSCTPPRSRGGRAPARARGRPRATARGS